MRFTCQQRKTINDLKSRTGKGTVECVLALNSADWNFEKAVCIIQGREYHEPREEPREEYDYYDVNLDEEAVDEFIRQAIEKKLVKQAETGEYWVPTNTLRDFIKLVGKPCYAIG